ncbi:MAG: UDP-N-acetylmuramate dehydrogenase [Blautia sp.]|nr:UDP-N-acetylmuramate dehydrogenase [Blautia sp.]
MSIYQQFCSLLGEAHVLQGEPLSRHTTFRVGGPADYFLSPSSEAELFEVLNLCSREKIPWFVLGNGSNMLVSDKGYRGAVIQLFRNWQEVQVAGNMIFALSGALLARVASAARDASLTGMEFAGGIPGTIGGAVMMNAGAYGGEMKDILVQVTAMTPHGEVRNYRADELDLGYRTSRFARSGEIVLSARMRLAKGDASRIQEEMTRLSQERSAKQPLDLPSAGSTFKRPDGYFAGKLIMDAGLRGYRIGDAQVSEKHCGFVVNTGNASAQDIYLLIRHIQDTVMEKSGVMLEPEVRMLGEFGGSSCAF